MIGALIGDIVGSVYENNNIKTKEFPLFSEHCDFTDDSVINIAVIKALLECDGNYTNLDMSVTHTMRHLGRMNQGCGFGDNFYEWIFAVKPKPYNSCGNGAAMRVAPVAWVATCIEQVKELSNKVTAVSHDHPDGIKGAEAVAVAVFMARNNRSKEEIKKYINENYYLLEFNLDSIRDTYEWGALCCNTVPQAIVAFLEGKDFEDCIRNAISIGGDSDTLACITGAIAEAYYGVPEDLRRKAYQFFTPYLLTPLQIFEKLYCGYKGDISFMTKLATNGQYKSLKKIKELKNEF